MESITEVQFSPFTSATDLGFWWTLSKKKLEEFQLAESTIEVNGYFSIGDPPRSSGRLNIDYTAFDEAASLPSNAIKCKGSLQIKNTIETFKLCDKKKLLNDEGAKIWKLMKSGSGLANPAEINRFLLLTYVDLKKYSFYYWFAFPACCSQQFKLIDESQHLNEYFNQSQLAEFSSVQDEYFKANIEHSHFLVHIFDQSFRFYRLIDYSTIRSQPGKILFGLCDPCTLDRYPGWPLRNYLALISYCLDINGPIEVLCFRQRFRDGMREIGHSIVMKVKMTSSTNKDEMPGIVGWERNERGKMGPRMVNLSSNMDPSKLLEASVDLNLKLMKWRLVPDLNLEYIQSCKCLLLGSGTLGCNVARGLMGWGIRNITFVDNSMVSYSNPVRQSLFNFEDCVEGGKPKAEAAALAMKKIFPQINSVGVQLSIPMPGHVVSENCLKEVENDVKILEELIMKHDAIFLLMDTRESRWLPTVIAAANSRLVINAALGFDSFLVMRHGLHSNSKTKFDSDEQSVARESKLHGSELGCYFCNDVVAPGDSTMNRSMDQQCTVARPGVSMIAAGMAVELLVSVLQHPEGGNASAEQSLSEAEFPSDSSTVLGIVPHHIRGFLSRFYNILPVCRRYLKCTACSPAVIEEYKSKGFDFLINAFNRPSFLEDLTGLTQLYEETNEAEVWELSD